MQFLWIYLLIGVGHTMVHVIRCPGCRRALIGTVLFFVETIARAFTWPIQLFFDIKELSNDDETEDSFTTEGIDISRRPWESDDEYRNRIKVEISKQADRAFEVIRKRENENRNSRNP